MNSGLNFGETAFAEQGGAEIISRLGRVRPQSNCLGEMRNGFVGAVRREQRRAELDVASA
jgi:hypothetical protein